MGLTFGPMGALLPELFPTEVRYTGASFSYNVSSILGASVAPVYCRMVAGELRSGGGRHLSGVNGRPDADCAAVDPRDCATSRCDLTAITRRPDKVFTPLSGTIIISSSATKSSDTDSHRLLTGKSNARSAAAGVTNCRPAPQRPRLARSAARLSPPPAGFKRPAHIQRRRSVIMRPFALWIDG